MGVEVVLLGDHGDEVDFDCSIYPGMKMYVSARMVTPVAIPWNMDYKSLGQHVHVRRVLV